MTNSGFSHKITALALIATLAMPPSSVYGLRQTNVRDNPDLEGKLAAGLEARVSQEDLDNLPVLSRLIILYGARKRIPSGDDDPAVTLRDWAAFRAQYVGAEGLISPERQDALRRAFLTAGGRMFLAAAHIPASRRAFQGALRRIHSLSGRRLTANGENRDQGEPKPLLALLPRWVAESQEEVGRIIRARAQGAAQPIGPGTRLEVLDRAPGLDNLDQQGTALNLDMLRHRLSSGSIGLSVRFPEKEGSPYTLELTRADTHKVQVTVIQKRLASLRRFHLEAEQVPVLQNVPMGTWADDLDDWLQENWDPERSTEHYGDAKIILRVVERNEDYAVVGALAAPEWVREHPELQQKLSQNLRWILFEDLGYGIFQFPVARYQFPDGKKEVAVIERSHILPWTLRLQHRDELEIRADVIESIGEWGRKNGIPVYFARPETVRENVRGLKEKTIAYHYDKPVDRSIWYSGPDTRLILKGSILTSDDEFRWFLYKGRPSGQVAAGLESAELRASMAERMGVFYALRREEHDNQQALWLAAQSGGNIRPLPGSLVIIQQEQSNEFFPHPASVVLGSQQANPKRLGFVPIQAGESAAVPLWIGQEERTLVSSADHRSCICTVGRGVTDEGRPVLISMHHDTPWDAWDSADSLSAAGYYYKALRFLLSGAQRTYGLRDIRLIVSPRLSMTVDSEHRLDLLPYLDPEQFFKEMGALDLSSVTIIPRARDVQVTSLISQDGAALLAHPDQMEYLDPLRFKELPSDSRFKVFVWDQLENRTIHDWNLRELFFSASEQAGLEGVRVEVVQATNPIVAGQLAGKLYAIQRESGIVFPFPSTWADFYELLLEKNPLTDILILHSAAQGQASSEFPSSRGTLFRRIVLLALPASRATVSAVQ